MDLREIARRCRRYKKGTSKLTRWLVTTADACTDVTHIVAALKSNKARKKVAAGADVELTTAEILQLGQAIGSAFVSLTIPSWTLRVTREVIEDRQYVAAVHAAISLAQYQALSKRDKSHQHFIQVLQDVLGLLQLAKLKTATAVATNASDSTAMAEATHSSSDAGTNQPSTFTMDDLSDDEQSAPGDTAPGTSSKVDLSKAKITLEQDDLDLAMAAWCHLQEMLEVRNFVHEAWQDWRNGQVSLLLASMVTGIGFALLECADITFGCLHPPLHDYGNLLDFLNLDMITFKGEPVTYIFKKHVDVKRSEEQVPDNIAELLCASGDGILDLFHQAAKSVQSNASASSQQQTEWHSLQGLVLDSVRCLTGLRNKIPTQELDEFSRGLQRYGSSTWMVVACQIQMEHLDTLGSDFTAGVSLLQESLSSWMAMSEAICETYCKAGSLEVSAQLQDVAADVQTAIERLQSYPPDQRRKTPSTSRKSASDRESFRNRYKLDLDCCFPVRAGGTAYAHKIEILELGTMLCNTGSCVISVALLLKACHHAGLCDTLWSDIDLLITAQSSEKPLLPVFDARSKRKDFVAAFEAATGKTYFAYHKKSSKSEPRLNKKRTTAYRSRDLPIGVKLDFTGRFIAKSKENVKKTSPTPVAKIVQTILYDMALKREDGDGDASMSAASRPDEEQELFSPVELLTLFRNVFILEEPVLNFDHVGLAKKCENMLKAISKTISGRRPDLAWMQHENELECLAWRILTEYAECSDGENAIRETMLFDVAAVIKENIEDSADVFTKAAYEKSSGHIPEHLRPGLQAVGEVDEEQKRRQEQDRADFNRAGTSVIKTGGLVAMHHPRLTLEDLDEAREEDCKPETSNLPSYMMMEEDGEDDGIPWGWKWDQ